MALNRALGSLVLLVVGLSPSLASAQHYIQTNLVVDSAAIDPKAEVDPNLRNAWGLVHGPSTPWWISDNTTGLSTVYDVSTSPPTIKPIVVTVPPAPGVTPPGTPTAVIFNGSTTDFLIAGKPALFIFVTEDGTISGWTGGTSAVIQVPAPKPSSTTPTPPKAVYKGATIAEVGGKKFLLVANFHSGRIDVFDSTFKRVPISEEVFDDDALPRGFAPFNVQGIGPNIYVTYAKQDAEKHDDAPGAGLGFVDVFSPRGQLLQRLQHGSWLNAPWGVTLAPADFGEFSHAILVGQFGSGTIAAYNPVTGAFLGNMLTSTGSTLSIDGLWGLAFGNGGASGPGSTLFFTAGPNGENDGAFGSLLPVQSELAENDEQ
ncbi:MAG TPA: TIGR03118 family protein [Vicinamibacterales bacterium]|nr:TIGR03118 family protein [Vicinamibacterales bacterium]